MRRTHRTHSHSSTEDDMMNLGYFASSSSASSNLSPLAPPFTVERSNHNKLNLNSNLESRFNGNSDGFNSAWPYSPSPTATQGVLADSIRTATVPSANSYTIPDHIAPPTTNNWSAMNSTIKSGLQPMNPTAVNPNPQGVVDSFSYNRTESVPFYYQFASMSSDDDDAAPMAPLNEHAFDSLHTKGFHGYGSSQVDYGQSLSGLKHGPQQVGTWSGLADDSKRKNSDSGHSFFSQDANVAGSLASKSYMNQGAYGAQTIIKKKEDSVIFPGMYNNRVAKENNIVPSVIGKSFSLDHGVISNGFSTEYTFSPFSKYSEANPLVPSLEPSKEPWNPQNRLYTPYEKKSNMFDSDNTLKFPSITKSSPSVVIKPPSTDNNRLNFEFKASSKIQVSEVNNTEDVKSVTNLSDHYTPGEDSPCWKGAPNHFSPFGALDADSSQNPMKKLQTSNDANHSKISSIEKDDISQDFQLKLPNLNMDAFVENDADFSTVEILDVNNLVKAMSNLTELLLVQCQKEGGLKEQDCKTLECVIGNLNVCMSKKIQQVDFAKSYTLPQDIASNLLQEEKNNDDSVRDNDLPKDHKMVQSIKKILDDNLDCNEDPPSNALLYKNLWLEAEAELCASGYKARFNRVKTEMDKSKISVPDVSEVASDVNKIPPSIFSPIVPEILHKDNPKVDGHNDAIENSVMARWNILKLRGESNPVNIEEKESENVELSVNEIQSSQKDDVVKNSLGNQKIWLQDDNSVMERLNILKSRGDPEKGVAEDELGMSSVNGTQVIQNQFQPRLYTSYSASSDWEHVLKDEFS